MNVATYRMGVTSPCVDGNEGIEGELAGTLDGTFNEGCKCG
jgi:hypothetical protein